jgi:O-antigen/teichoic acid export membrane protein
VSTAPSGSVIARSLGWMGAGHAVGQVFWFGSLIVLGALLEPSDFGIVAVGLVVVWIGNVLIGTGVRAGIITTPDLSGADVRAATAFSVGTGLALAVAVAALAGPLARAFASGGQAAALQGLALAVLFIGVTVVPMAVLDKEMAFKRSAQVKVAATFGAAVAAIIAGVAGAGVWALVARQVLYHGLVALLAWVAVRDLLPRGGAQRGRLALRRAGSRAFFVLTLADFVAFAVDSLVVGALTDASRMGLYSLAFTLAFAPLTQFAWQIGLVLFPAAAATDDRALVAQRTLVAIRMVALVLLPFVPVAIVLAPVLVPAVLGERWEGMVVPFQILLVAGVAHAVLVPLSEALSGTGGIWFRARAHAVWGPATVAAVALLVVADGIRGAAVAHLALLVPLWAAYALRGARIVGLGPGDLWGAARGVVVPVAVQALLTAAVVVALESSGADAGVAAAVATAAGLAAAAVLLARGASSPLRETLAIVGAARRGAPAAG